MKKCMTLKYEDFDNKFEYIDYLEDNGLITHGCAVYERIRSV